LVRILVARSETEFAVMEMRYGKRARLFCSVQARSRTSTVGVSEKYVAYAVKLALRLFSEEAEKTNGVNRGRSLRESPLRMGLS
jgi:hypothetical protein